jgi:hypothetical protein
MIGPRRIKDALLRRLRRALDNVEDFRWEETPCDNNPHWIGMRLQQLMLDEQARSKPGYIWGVLQGVALAKVLDIRRVSVIEFGVAGGAGLLSLERIAEHAEEFTGIEIEVYGFDTGRGLPKPDDYRDCPNLFLDSAFPMDREALNARLRRATLELGEVKDTVPAFVNKPHAPVAFVSIDVDFYSSTREVLRLFEASNEHLLPRVVCYFDDIIGLTYCDYNGERLAMREFNAEHSMRKICPMHGLKYFVPRRHRHHAWPGLLYFAHLFDHPLYNQQDEFRRAMIMDIDGKETDWRITRVD